MADYISRETAEQVICEVCERPGCPRLWGHGCNRIDRLYTIPAADVVEVVRCKDCIHAPLPGDCEGGSNMEWPKIDGIYEDCTCPHFCDDDWYSARPDPEGFCEKGERRGPNLDTTKGDQL